MENLQKILTKAEELFFQFGIKSVTMDDLSKALGSSKKTLYQFILNKTDLVNKTMAAHLRLEKKQITEIVENSDNAIDEMYEIAKNVIQQLRYVNPSAVYDLRKYYPEAWQMMQDYKDSFILETIKRNIEKGQAQGLYREDIDPAIIAKIYAYGSDVLVDVTVFPPTEFTLIGVYTEFIKHHVRGMASPKGLAYLEQLNLGE